MAVAKSVAVEVARSRGVGGVHPNEGDAGDCWALLGVGKIGVRVEGIEREPFS